MTDRLTCSKCKAELDTSQFYKDNTRKRGYRCRCKSCMNSDGRGNQEKNGEKIRANARKRYKNNSVKLRVRSKNRYDNNKNKHHAKTAVNRAVASGKLVKTPCVVCGSKKSQGHHENGYGEKEWLNVIWLCDKHHKRRHSEINNKITLAESIVLSGCDA